MTIVLIAVLLYLAASALLVRALGRDETTGSPIWLWPALPAMLLHGGYHVMVAMRTNGGPDMHFFAALSLVGLGMAWLTSLVGARGRMSALGVVVFPLAALLVGRLQLPPWLFLAVFLFMLVLFWSTFRSQVPFYPSGRSAWDAVAALLPEGRPVRFMDIGSGLGGAVLDLSRRRPDSIFTGIEIAPLPWLVSRVRAALAGNRCRFVRGDYLLLDFADYDVVFAHLSPAAMLALWHKARAEMRPGSLLLSYEFHIPGSTPDLVIQPEGGGPVLHGWRM